MQASSSFKQAFLKHMLMGIKLGGVFSKSMSLQERQRAIKLSADAAMALARGHTNWSRAIAANLSKEEKDKVLVRSIFGKKRERLSKPCKQQSWKIPRSKKILRRSLIRSCTKIRKHGVKASVLARRMVKKRTQVLKKLIPGGESLDGISLLGETLDYVIYLRAQVHLMQQLTRALGASNLKFQKEYTLQGKRLNQLGNESL